MNKSLKITGGLDKKADIICRVIFSELAPTEHRVLMLLIKFAINNQVALTIELSKQIKSEGELTDTAFSTSLFRLEKKGVVKRKSRNVTIHPAFHNITEMNKLIINFE